MLSETIKEVSGRITGAIKVTYTASTDYGWANVRAKVRGKVRARGGTKARARAKEFIPRYHINNARLNLLVLNFLCRVRYKSIDPKVGQEQDTRYISPKVDLA